MKFKIFLNFLTITVSNTKFLALRVLSFIIRNRNAIIQQVATSSIRSFLF